jgi:hypothetical protein
MTNAIAKEITGQNEEFDRVERVPSTRTSNVAVPTERQWDEYKRGLATAKALERKEMELGLPLRIGSDEWQDVVDNVDEEAELSKLKAHGKDKKNLGWPHAKGTNQTINNRWDFRPELGKNPEERRKATHIKVDDGDEMEVDQDENQ